jgi:uncharacterized membrane protein/protein-disulfide isomerase
MNQSSFTPPVRWVLRVLSWLAFGVSAYLAWHTVNHTSVAGCGVGTHNGCDAVLSSSWSKWLGVPVALPGLACYATLAGLSVLLGIQSSAARLINTAFMLLAILAGGASLWFIALQLFAIGAICRFCLTADLCGLVIGGIAIWHAFRWWNGTTRAPAGGGGSPSGLSALRHAIPGGTRATATASATRAPVTAAAPARAVPSSGSRTVALVGRATSAKPTRLSAEPPSISLAFGGAMALLVLLIGGQILFPSKTFNVQQVALNQSFDVSNGADSTSPQSPGDGQTRVAMRVPADEIAADSADDASADDGSSNAASTDSKNTTGNGNASETAKNDAQAGGNSEETKDSDDKSTKSQRSRLVKFLNGKLTLDTYKHPIIGSPEAPHVAVEMVSYDCQHCRKTHSAVKRALSRHRDEVALIVLVVPLEKRCNKLVTDAAASHPGACTTAQMALGIAQLKRPSFPRFHDFLMKGENEPPPLTTIISKAYAAVDRNKLRELRESGEVDKQIAANVDLYAMLQKQNAGNNKFGLPVQILGDHVMSGGVESSDDLIKAWEEHLGLKGR